MCLNYYEKKTYYCFRQCFFSDPLHLFYPFGKNQDV